MPFPLVPLSRKETGIVLFEGLHHVTVALLILTFVKIRSCSLSFFSSTFLLTCFWGSNRGIWLSCIIKILLPCIMLEVARGNLFL